MALAKQTSFFTQTTVGGRTKTYFLVVPCMESDLPSTQNNFIFISPKIGVVFVIPVEAGEILDYEVKSLFSRV